MLNVCTASTDEDANAIRYARAQDMCAEAARGAHRAARELAACEAELHAAQAADPSDGERIVRAETEHAYAACAHERAVSLQRAAENERQRAAGALRAERQLTLEAVGL